MSRHSEDFLRAKSDISANATQISSRAGFAIDASDPTLSKTAEAVSGSQTIAILTVVVP